MLQFINDNGEIVEYDKDYMQSDYRDYLQYCRSIDTEVKK